MIKNNEYKINELREKLYIEYDRKQLSKILNVSENHVSRLLNNQSVMSISQYFILLELIKCNK